MLEYEDGTLVYDTGIRAQGIKTTILLIYCLEHGRLAVHCQSYVQGPS
jgi:hypothetical protein